MRVGIGDIGQIYTIPDMKPEPEPNWRSMYESQRRIAETFRDAYHEAYMQLCAIEARIDGEWDNEYLMRYGALGDTLSDIKRILDE